MPDPICTALIITTHSFHDVVHFNLPVNPQQEQYLGECVTEQQWRAEKYLPFISPIFFSLPSPCVASGSVRLVLSGNWIWSRQLVCNRIVMSLAYQIVLELEPWPRIRSPAISRTSMSGSLWVLCWIHTVQSQPGWQTVLQRFLVPAMSLRQSRGIYETTVGVFRS